MKHGFLSVIIGLILVGFLAGCPKPDPWVTVADSNGGDEVAIANGKTIKVYGDLVVNVYDAKPDDVRVDVYGEEEIEKACNTCDVGWVALGAGAIIAGVGLFDGGNGGSTDAEFYHGTVELNVGETVWVLVFVKKVQVAAFFARNIANGNEGNGEGENTNTETMPVITGQPNSLNVAVGAQAVFTVGATGGGLHYQWLDNDVPITANPASTGVNTATLTILSAGTINDGWYSCIVSNSRGSIECNPAQLTVNGNNTETMPVITLQPDSQTVAIGTQVTFHVEATGGNLSYQWYDNDVAITANSASTGVNTATLTILSAGTINDGWYSCIVSNSKGSVECNPAQLTVGTADPGGTINVNLTWTKSTNVLTASVTGANAGWIGLELYHQTGGSPWIERQGTNVASGSANWTVSHFRPNMLRFGVVSDPNAGGYLPFSALSVKINGTAIPLVDVGGNRYAYQVDVSTLP